MQRIDPEQYKTFSSMLDAAIRKNEMQFALETIIYNLFVTSLILIISYFIDSFQETFLLFCIFGIFRITAGGFHFNHIIKCIIVTSVLMIGEGKVTQLIQLNPVACLVISLFTNTIFFLHTPKGTANNPFSGSYSQLQQKRLKIISVFFSFLAICIASIRTILLFAMLTAAILLVPDLPGRFRTFR